MKRLIDIVMDYLKMNDGLENVKFDADETKGVATIYAYKDGCKIVTTINTKITNEPLQFIENKDERKVTLDTQIQDFLIQGYTQSKIADILGVSQSYVSNVKRSLEVNNEEENQD